jgi:predicted  nucleic acid-binding Zn-ribbon protein
MKIPDAWGVMSPPSGRRKRTMTIIKEAPLLKPVNKEPALVRLMTWHAQKQRDEIRQLEIEKRTLENRITGLKHDVQSAKVGRGVDYEEQKVFEIYHEYKKRLKDMGDSDPYGSYGVGKNEREDVIETLIDLRAARLLERKIDSENRAIVNALSALTAAMERTEEISQEIKKVTRLQEAKNR